MLKTKEKVVSTPVWQTILTIFFLIFFFPLGVLFMFIWMKWPLWVKIVISFGIIFFMILISIMAAIAVIAINPLELTHRSRDAVRLSNLADVQRVMNVSMQSDQGGLCADGSSYCEGNSIEPGARAVDGTGWIKIDFAKLNVLDPQTGKALMELPVDPVNDSAHFYRYCSDGKNWEIETRLESAQMAVKAKEDGGPHPGLYEVGSNLNLCK